MIRLIEILFLSLLLTIAAPSGYAQESSESPATILSLEEVKARVQGKSVADPVNETLAASDLLTSTLASGSFDYRGFMKRTRIEDRHDVYPPAEIVSFSYELDEAADDQSRPVLFMFNGGPGSASIWLHMTGFGPEKTSARFADEPAGDVVLSRGANDGFLIDVADLVFVDPVGTGLSRVLGDGDEREFQDLRVDARAMCRFAQNWLEAEGRVGAPVYVLGVSYSTLRAAGMASHSRCRDFRENLHGLILVSGLLDLRMRHGRDLTGPASYFPSIAAIAWHRGRVDRSQWSDDIDAFLDAMEAYADTTILPAMAQEHRLTDAERRALMIELHEKIGISPPNETVDSIAAAIRNARRQVDGRATACSYDARFDCGRSFGSHPNLPLLPFGEDLEDELVTYLSDRLNYELNPEAYSVMREQMFRTNWDYRFHKSLEIGSGTDMADTLVRQIILPRPSPNETKISSLSDLVGLFGFGRGSGQQTTRIMVASGIHDLVTPYFAMELALLKAGLEPSQFEMHRYYGGHMMYVEKETGHQLAADIRSFIRAGE